MAIIPNGAITAIAHYIETSEQIVLVRSFLTVCFFALSQIWGRDVLFQPKEPQTLRIDIDR